MEFEVDFKIIWQNKNILKLNNHNISRIRTGNDCIERIILSYNCPKKLKLWCGKRRSSKFDCMSDIIMSSARYRQFCFYENKTNY